MMQNRRMHIALVSATFPPYEAGIGNACYHTARQLAALGHDVHVYIPLGRFTQRLAEDDLPFRLHYLRPVLTLAQASVVPALESVLARADVLHLYYPFFGGDIFVQRAGQRHHLPYFVSYQQDLYGGTLLKKIAYRSYNLLLQRRLMLGAEKVLALSSDHIAHSQIRYVVDIPGKVAVIPNGVNIEDFAPQSDVDARSRHGIAPGVPIIVFNAALDAAHYFKRLDLLLHALHRLPIQAHLLVIGDGNLRPRYEALAQDLGIADRVTFLGKVPNRDVAPYLHASVCLVLPSTDTESFGIVLVEAMACGKPIIASNLHGVRATVRNGVNGLLFERGNVNDLMAKLEQLLRDPELAERLGREGYRTVEQEYTWKHIASRLISLYQDALIRKGAGR